jgi:tripeptide aminopeptidase
MPLGRIDEQTTANVGMIEGGVARNIVPPNCLAWAEARSRDEASLTRLSQQIVDAATAAAQETGCEVEIGISGEYRGYRHKPGSAPVALAREALEQAGFEVVLMESGGGADANVFNEAGVPCVNLCNGMAEIHTADEWISVADLEAMTAVTRRLIDLAHRAI